MAAGRTTGFDYLRLGLAVAILCFHSIDVSYGVDFTVAFENGLIRPLVTLRLPMFFALSGFLVAGSLDRCRSLISFVGLRAIRVAPALAFQTLIVALVIGPLLTRAPLADYFGDGQLARYFLNVAGAVHYVLPGVFETNPWPRTVNAQLWTVPFELLCYVSFAALAALGLHRRPQAFVVCVVGLNLVLAAHYMISAAAAGWNGAPVAPAPALALAFFFGAALHLCGDHIVHSTRLGLFSGAVAMALLIHPATDYLVPLPAAYFTVWLGLLRPRPCLVTRHRDYSYGVFLFGFPIQQAVTALVAPRFHEWGWNIAAALPLTILLAVISWHLVEKPSLALRAPLKRLEERLLARPRGRATGRAPAVALDAARP